MKDCKWDATIKACSACKIPMASPSILRNCVDRHAIGLGDRVASALSSAGITKERAHAFAKIVGLSDCGCRERQESMNKFGREFLGIGVPHPPPPDAMSSENADNPA